MWLATGPDTRRWLLHVAREALTDALGVRVPAQAGCVRPDDPELERPARAFVSWHEGPRLVGCIGTLKPKLPLEATVRTYAVEAGLHDPRTIPATPSTLPNLCCEISILGDPAPMRVTGTAAIARELVPGRDGLVIRHGARRAVFLPVVWESLREPDAFVAALCHKAGIDAHREGEHVLGETFSAEKFGEAALPD